MSLENEPIYNLSLKKSNKLISSKYKSTLLENQIMAVALTRIEQQESKTGEPVLSAKLYPGELKKLIGEDNIYKTLKRVANTITSGHSMLIEDGNGNFKSFSMVPNAQYQDGVFEITFNHELAPHVFNLKKNYTTLQLSVITDFEKGSALRIYELLKSEAYQLKEKEIVEIEYGLSEFKFIIGLVDIDSPEIANLRSRMGANLDYDVLYEALDKKSKKYEEYKDLRRRVLEPAQEEIKNKSDIQFEFQGIKHGKKIVKLLFIIQKNENKDENASRLKYKQQIIEENSIDDPQYRMPRHIKEYEWLYDSYIDHNELTEEDITLLLRKGSWNTQLVEEAIKAADEQDYITNYMGWMIRYIEAGGYNKTETIKGSAERATRVRTFMESYEAADKGPMNERLWAKIQGKEDYPNFQLIIESMTGSFETYNSIYDTADKIEHYAAWKRGDNIEL